MKIKVNAPPPAPPKTYDIVGLTRDQMVSIYHALGYLCSNEYDNAYELAKGTSSKIFDVLYDLRRDLGIK